VRRYPRVEDVVNPDQFSADAARYRILFERSHVGMVFVSLDGTVTAVNPAVCELWGRSAEEVIGMAGPELPHPDDRADAVASMEGLRDGTVDAVRAERRYLRPDGRTVWADLTTLAVRGPDGEVLYWQSVLVDITERKKAQEDQARLAAIVQSSQDAIIGTALDFVITSWNPGAERLYGYSAEEVVGRRADILVAPEDRDEGERTTARTVAGERVEQYVTKRLRKDGTRVSVSVSASPIFDRSGGDRWAGVGSARPDRAG
jgi:PAS domain S-box-containing protein